ncbi:hypothetical protein, partial [Chroococcidiopsis sp [FACHB-1243]]|uniref:hypothetical protein n=1 Tax=Chroococcidiopsis sp. [FACHB-1243] TaxID=2692781 RepID=UPI001A7EBDCA
FIIHLSIWQMKRWVSRLLFPTVWCLEHILQWSYWRRAPERDCALLAFSKTSWSFLCLNTTVIPFPI